MSEGKILLDGHGIKLKAIRGILDDSCPRRDKGKGYREITVETNKGDFYVIGCSACHVLGAGWTGSEFTTKHESDEK